MMTLIIQYLFILVEKGISYMQKKYVYIFLQVIKKKMIQMETSICVSLKKVINLFLNDKKEKIGINSTRFFFIYIFPGLVF